MSYEAQKYDDLVGINGLSDELLKNHFTLYEGYVKNTNHILEYLEKKEDETIVSELKRRFGWEFNGMRLHELYFDNLVKGGKELDLASSLHEHLASSWGSQLKWAEEFRVTAGMRGIGWVVLCYDKSKDKLFNCWINEHDGGHLAGCTLIIVTDVFEHAYMLDYGTKRAGYIDAFFKNLDWSVVEKRFESVL